MSSRGSDSATTVASKPCRGACGRTLPATVKFFHPDGRRRDGSVLLKSRCRECVDTQRREYRASLKGQGPPVAQRRTGKPRGVMLPAPPLGDRIHRAVALRVLSTGAAPKDVWRAFYERSGFSEKRVFDWRFKQRTVTACIAYEALDAVDLLLVDAYTPEQLAVLPPVEID